ncbi:MAG: tRNA (guanosine(46)-N7)-methyltransferase TrmB [Caldilineaceae bacterium]|nr:tRNA (guanosine(46)-N7)-methyltransferase TrmB [Caldilineaceae bacterium]
MDFAWEELTPAQRARHYADWHAGKGLIGGDPRQRPNSDLLPSWAMGRSFVRALALDDCRAANGKRFRHQTAGPCPLEIEIGFGRGDFLLDRAARWPERWFVGFEVRTRAVRLALRRLENQQLENLWLSDDDARVGLQQAIPDRRVDAVHVLFPDPWWKAQHKVKRLFSPPFVDLLAAKIRPGGYLHLKTDVEQYGGLVRHLLSHHPAFCDHRPELADRVGPYRPTHREHWCRENGKPVWTYHFFRRHEA